jgi:hypothetical protein
MPTFEESSAFRGAAGWPAPRLFNKSLVRSFSSFEKLIIGTEVFQATPPVFQQKPGTQLFFFRETSPSARSSLKPP